MADIVTQRNIGALGDLLRLSDQASLTAASTGDATTVTGVTIDREGFAGGSLPDSALIGLMYSATLASGKTLSVTFDVQDSADNSSFADYATQTATVIATGVSGGGVAKGEANFQVNLRAARRYVRVLFLPDLSATVTDTAVAMAVGFFGGFDRLVAPQT